MADKTDSKDRLREITDNIEQGIKELFQSDKYMEYLSIMSRFHNYSLNNTLLISMQKPNATVVAGFNKWRDQFGRSVKKGEKGIKIIAPTPYKVKKQMEKLDPVTKTPMRDKSGAVITEEVEVKIPMYRVVSVFDVAQTEGKPLPHLASNLTGDVKQYDVFIEALRRSAPVPIAFEAMEPSTDGYFSSTEQRIAIREGMSEVQTVSAVIHEIAHSKLHDREKQRIAAAQSDENAEPPKPKNRRTEEVEAESISYAVCQYYGIQTGENSFGYIAEWSKNKELPELRASLEIINKTSAGLIDDVDRNFAEIVKEQGLDLAPQEQTAAEPAAVIEPPAEVESRGNDHIADVSASAQTVTPQAERPTFDVSEFSEPQWAQIKLGWDAGLNVSPYANPDIDPARMAEIRLGLEKELEVALPVEEHNFPMPDPTVGIAERNAYGYADEDMLPLSQERAGELFAQDLTVYLLYGDNTEAMAFDSADIETHNGLFGISREDWTATQEYEAAKSALVSPTELQENLFLESDKNAFAIYQLKSGEELRDYRFEGLKWLDSRGLSVEHSNYEFVYTEPFTRFAGTRDRLEELWERFNSDLPADFKGHSLSVSDIIAIKQSNVVTYHYCDSFDFVELKNFLPAANYLETAEKSTEQNLNQLDGVLNNQPTVAQLEAEVKAGGQISLSDLTNAIKNERKKPSLVEQLKNQPVKREKSKAAPTKGAEMER